MTASVTYDAKGGLARVTLNRRAVRSGLDTARGGTLVDCAEEAASGGAVFLVIVRGAGRAFCSGMDRPALAGGRVGEPFYRYWIRALNLLEDLPKVTAAVLHG